MVNSGHGKSSANSVKTRVYTSLGILLISKNYTFSINTLKTWTTLKLYYLQIAPTQRYYDKPLNYVSHIQTRRALKKTKRQADVGVS